MLHAYVVPLQSTYRIRIRVGVAHTFDDNCVATMANPLTCGYFGFVPGINKAYDFWSLFIYNTLAVGMFILASFRAQALKHWVFLCDTSCESMQPALCRWKPFSLIKLLLVCRVFHFEILIFYIYYNCSFVSRLCFRSPVTLSIVYALLYVEGNPSCLFNCDLIIRYFSSKL